MYILKLILSCICCIYLLIQVRGSGKAAIAPMENVILNTVNVQRMEENAFQVYVSGVMLGESRNFNIIF